jgi:mono/diheme cytochrome c family protein
MKNLITYCAATVLVLSCWSATTGAQSAQAPRIVIDSLAGRDSFELYCAACHGGGGRGDGPVAAELRTRPSDLTQLGRRNNGAFPSEAVREFITGTARALPAHGTTEMPVWGPMFRAFESDARVHERIANLVTYIERLQQPQRGATISEVSCSGATAPVAMGGMAVATDLWLNTSGTRLRISRSSRSATGGRFQAN